MGKKEETEKKEKGPVRAAPTAQEYRRDPTMRDGRPIEPGGVADRPAPAPTSAQASFDAIQELRKRSEKTLPGTLGAMARFSLEDQIKKLQSGGTPVRSGNMTVGVISKGGVYTGRPEFGDLARSSYKTAGATIQAPIGGRQQPSERSDRTQAPAETPSPTITAPATQPSAMADDAVRRAQLSSGASGAARRRYIRG